MTSSHFFQTLRQSTKGICSLSLTSSLLGPGGSCLWHVQGKCATQNYLECCFRIQTIDTKKYSQICWHFFAMQKVPTSNTEGGWSFSLAEYIRHNDMPIYEASERVLRAFQDELMPAESLSELFDVVGQYAFTFIDFPSARFSSFWS